jgi:arsenite methyltransferase
MSEQLLDSVKSKYGAVAESTLSNDHAGVKAVAEAFGYSAEELTSIPAGANMGLSCGNPTATAHLRAGEVVVDLGSGGGLDVFLASKMVGPEGRAIGIDMTTAMIERSRENAQKGGYTNVEFYQVHHRPDSASGCYGRLHHLELRRESGTRQACCLPRDRARPEARWPGCAE